MHACIIGGIPEYETRATRESCNLRGILSMTHISGERCSAKQAGVVDGVG